MNIKNLPEIIYGLSKEDIAFDETDPENKNDLYQRIYDFLYRV